MVCGVREAVEVYSWVHMHEIDVFVLKRGEMGIREETITVVNFTVDGA